MRPRASYRLLPSHGNPEGTVGFVRCVQLERQPPRAAKRLKLNGLWIYPPLSKSNMASKRETESD
jgi:hypothetical protein